MRTLLFCLLAGLAACSESAEIVVVNRLAAGGGGAGSQARPQFDVVVALENPATGFRPPDLMRVLVDGQERVGEVFIGGYYAVLRIEPAPVGTHVVQLGRRTGPLIDSFTWTVNPYTGPTVASVTPDQAQAGAPVTIAGANLAGTDVRVWIGGVEAVVTAAAADSITATVPAGAIPGLVYVQIDGSAAEGALGFLPLDAADQPIPVPAFGPVLFAVFDARGTRESVVRFYGHNFNAIALPVFSGAALTEVIRYEIVDLPPAGPVATALAVIPPHAPPGAGFFGILQDDIGANIFPFTVD